MIELKTVLEIIQVLRELGKLGGEAKPLFERFRKKTPKIAGWLSESRAVQAANFIRETNKWFVEHCDPLIGYKAFKEINLPSTDVKIIRTIAAEIVDLKHNVISAMQAMLDEVFFDNRVRGAYCYRVALFEPLPSRKEDREQANASWGLFPVCLAPSDAKCSLLSESSKNPLGFNLAARDHPSLAVKSYRSLESIITDNAQKNPDWRAETQEHRAESLYACPTYIRSKTGAVLRYGVICIDCACQGAWEFVEGSSDEFNKLIKAFRQMLLLIYSLEYFIAKAAGHDELTERFELRDLEV